MAVLHRVHVNYISEREASALVRVVIFTVPADDYETAFLSHSQAANALWIPVFCVSVPVVPAKSNNGDVYAGPRHFPR
jgi:hypothetical protein